jgi:four helix bundle protein
MKQATARNHHQLRVWQLAMELAEACYRLSARLPTADRFGLTAQLRRAAISIPPNVAEGAARDSSLEFARFVSIARGSLSELETHLLLAERLKLLEPVDDIHRKIRGLRLMLTALRRALLARRSRSAD